MKRIVSKEQTITTHFEEIRMFIAFLIPDLFVSVEQNKLLKQRMRIINGDDRVTQQRTKGRSVISKHFKAFP